MLKENKLLDKLFNLYKKPIYTIGLLFFAIPFSMRAEIPIVINDAKKDFYLTEEHFSVIEDKHNRLTIDSIITISIKNKFDNSILKIDQEDNITTYWYRFTVINELENNNQIVFELLNFKLDEVSFFVQDLNGVYIESKGGDKFPFSIKNIDHKNFLFFLPFSKKGEVKTCFLRVKMNDIVDSSVRSVIRTEEQFISYALKEYHLLGFFYGILLIMIIYNLVLWISIKSSSYLIYIIYILSVAFYSLSWNGLGFQYLWKEYPFFNEYALTIASFLLVFWASIYAKKFLMISTQLPSSNKFFTSLIFTRLLLFIFDLLFVFDFTFVVYLDFLILLVGYSISIIIYIKGYSPAKFYIAAYSALFLGFLILTLVQLEWIKPNIFTVYGLEFGVIFELIFFSMALAEKYKMLQLSEAKSLKLAIDQLQENEKLKDKVNRELEDRVLERTEELNNANIKLKEQSEKISQMNLLLDMDNRKLQNNIKELYSARVFLKEVEMEEFYKLYPTDDSCYKFLSLLKWDDKFECKKCKNDKFFWGKTPFAHRCTKCGYEESVTANTIFHNMRIPILKAFYITFIVYSSNEKIKSVELAELLSLRQKTCWKYKKIISERIADRKRTMNVDNLGGWDTLILD